MTSLLRECEGLGTNGAEITSKLRLLAKERLVLDPYLSKIDVEAANQLDQLTRVLAEQAWTLPSQFQKSATQFEAVLNRVFPGS